MGDNGIRWADNIATETGTDRSKVVREALKLASRHETELRAALRSTK
jgi:hypothetical protein